MTVFTSVDRASNSAPGHLTHYSVDAFLSTKIEVHLFENLKVVFLHKLNIGDRTFWLSVGELLRLHDRLRPSSVVCTECIVAKRCVLEQKLLRRFDTVIRNYTRPTLSRGGTVPMH